MAVDARKHAAKRTGCDKAATAVPTRSKGPGIPIAIVAGLGFIAVATGSGLPAATGRTPPANGLPGYSAEASVWQICIKNRDLLSSSTTTSTSAEESMPEGCTPVEDSLCKNQILTMVQIARAAHLIACLMQIAVFVFAILDRLSLIGGVPGNPDTHNTMRIVSWSVAARRRIYVAGGLLTALLVMAGAIPSTRLLSADCLGPQVSVNPGIIIQWIATLFGVVVAIVAAFHTDTPDYVAITKVLEEQKNRVQQRAATNLGGATAVNADNTLYGASPGACAHGNGNGAACVSSFVPEEELQRVRAQSARNAAAGAQHQHPSMSPAERTE